MTIHELALLAAHVFKALYAGGRDIALLVRANDLRPHGWAAAGERGAPFTETCVVRALQARAQAGLADADYFLYTTVKPTLMCLGMGKRCHVSHYFYLGADGPKVLSPADPGALSLLGAAPLDPLRSRSAGDWGGGWSRNEGGLRASRGGPLEALCAGRLEVVNEWFQMLLRVEQAALWVRDARDAKLAAFAGPRLTNPPAGAAWGPPVTELRHKIWLGLAFALLHTARQAPDPEVAGKNIGCVLIGPDGGLLSWGVNTNATNVTLHGEVNCIQELLRRTAAAVPDGSTVYTTLQSCEMCAGMIATTAARVRVVYGSRDPGIGPTALSTGKNGCGEAQFQGAHANPLARAKFQRAVARVIARRQETRAQAFGAEVTNRYAATHKPDMSGVPSHQRGAVGKKFTEQKRQVTEQAKQRYRQQLLQLPFFARLARLERRLPQAITSALDEPQVTETIGQYAREYGALGKKIVAVLFYRAMLAEVQHLHPGNIVEFGRLQDHVRELLRAEPILGHATVEDALAWLAGNALLEAAGESVLQA